MRSLHIVPGPVVAAAAPAPSVELGLRERKRQRTRERLIDAAIELATEHGFASVTIDQISYRADVSPRTFFNYFACKEAAVLGLDESTRQRLRASIAAAPAGPAIAALRFALLDLADQLEHDSRRWHARVALLDASPEIVAYQLRDLADAETLLATALIARDDALDRRTALLAVRLALGALRTALDDWGPADLGDAPDADHTLIAVMGAVFDDAAALFAP